MSIAPGSRLGPYEVLSLVGAGGMGEVYRAQDTRLGRTVAVKVLPLRLSSSPEFRLRFEREAKTISRLSHPHICALYDVGDQDGVGYLVMEYLEGETLAKALSRGPLPLEQTLRYGTQIAHALDRAHIQGIVHRDLKPGNVMVTKSGVKLLDFGLAKAFPPPSSSLVLMGLSTQPPPAGHAPLTEAGAILGTFQYMAPEQLDGREVDARTDIFALGSVIYEMSTGRKAFSGDSQAALIASVMTSDPPPLSRVHHLAPPALDRIVRTCLSKDPEGRWQSARDIALQLDAVSAGAGGPPPRAARRGPALWMAAAVLLLAAALLLLVSRSSAPGPSPSRMEPVTFSVAPPGPSFLMSVAQAFFTVSPDGRSLAFVAKSPGGHDLLWIRPLRSLSATPLAATEGAAGPFWSPDSRWIGFFAQGKLKKMEAAGGTPLTVCDTPGPFLAGTWGSGGRILFAQLAGTDIYSVPAAGGTPVPVLKASPEREEWSVCWPYILPDSRHFIYVGRSARAHQTYLRLGDLETGESVPLLSGCSRAEYVPADPGETGAAGTGSLLFGRDGGLLAVPFDAAAGRLAGEPRSVAGDLWTHLFTGVGAFSASRGGVLAHRAEKGAARLEWFDRQGRSAGREAGPGIDGSLRLSPDGRKVVARMVEPRSGTGGLWVGEVGSGLLHRLTEIDEDDWFAVWSPDGRTVGFSRGTLRAPPSLYQISLDGGQPRELTPSAPVDPATGRLRGVQWLSDWSADGRFVSYSEWTLERRSDLFVLELGPPARTIRFLSTPVDEEDPKFSPDGRWIAYTSDEPGTTEVYVAPFPGPGERLRVSTAGGSQPRWRRDGSELFYISGDNHLISVPLRSGAALEPGAAQLLFNLDAAGWRDYDVAPDGRKFLAAVNSPEDRSGLIIIDTDWRTALREAPRSE